MANRSTFPTKIDSFIEHYEISATDIPLLRRFQELKLKTSLTPMESDELASLTSRLRDKLHTAEDFNKLQDAITNLQIFFRDKVDGYVQSKQNQMEAFVEEKETYITEYADNSVLQIKNYADNSVADMRNIRDGFTTFVNTKEDRVRSLVQEFDSNTARYYQSWVAADGQIEFNIYDGQIKNIPREAKLNIREIDIDLIINGTVMTPNIDYNIKNNGDFDTIILSSNAASIIADGTEIIAKWYKNVGKLYFSHASSHELGGSDEIKNLDEKQLKPELQNKISSKTSISINESMPTTDIWFKVMG